MTPAPDPERRRLLLLTTELRPAGAERVVAELALGLDPARWQVWVASLWSPGGQDGAVADELRARGVPVVALRLRGKLDLPRAAGLIRLLRRFRPHVLHAHLFHANLAARLLGRLGGARRVVATHHVVERRPLPARRLLERLTAGRDDVTVCVSEAVARFARERLGASPARLRVIPDGVDLARFSGPAEDPAAAREALGLPREGPLLVGVGRLTGQKGWDVLLRALPRLLEAHPSLLLALAGQGQEEAALRALAAGLGLAPRVRFLGFRSDPERVLRAADVVVIPSRWEGFGLVAVEALAAGRAVVASAVDSLPEVLGQAALLVPPEDPLALAGALRDLLDDPARRAALAAGGPARAAQFDARAMIAAYAALYEELAVV